MAEARLRGRQLAGKDGGCDKMVKKKQSAAVPVKDALFFPEDFTKLHRRHVIYIKQGVIIDLDKL
jgi:hypothetical protein